VASIRKEFTVKAPAHAVWDAIRDVGAVHVRLVPGLVTNVELEDGARVVTFANGLVAREAIVDIDDDARRLAYASQGGRLSHHNASMQVFEEGENAARVVWITDLLPNEFTEQIAGLMEKGAQIAAMHLSSRVA
jgi:carbon monoxide dehydrogenase subunit G